MKPPERTEKSSNLEMARVAELFWVFLRLGLTSFGGPVAHIGYFRRQFVTQMRWLSEAEFAALIALCQFLPGPASSQAGFAIGLMRAGWLGAVAAFLGFTLPSLVLMFLFATALPWFGTATLATVLHALKLVALAVVAHAVLGMSRQLLHTRLHATLAVLAAAAILTIPLVWLQPAVVLAGLIIGAWLSDDPSAPRDAPAELGWTRLPSRSLGVILLVAFGALLLALPYLAQLGDGPVDVLDIFYRSGALVFGGGHVVLPLLQQGVVAPGLMTQDTFLSGYGAAQAMPGPLFSIAAFLGAEVAVAGGALSNACLATIGIFLPGFLLVAGALPFWRALCGNAIWLRAIGGANAAVVGLLGAALYQPIFTSAVARPADLAIGLIGFALLEAWRLSPLWVIVWSFAAVLLFGSFAHA